MYLVIGFKSSKRTAKPTVVYSGHDGAAALSAFDENEGKHARIEFFKHPQYTRRKFHDVASVKSLAEVKAKAKADAEAEAKIKADEEAKVKAEAEAEAKIKADEEAKVKQEVSEPSLIPADSSEIKQSDKPSGGKPAKLKK